MKDLNKLTDTVTSTHNNSISTPSEFNNKIIASNKANVISNAKHLKKADKINESI